MFVQGLPGSPGASCGRDEPGAAPKVAPNHSCTSRNNCDSRRCIKKKGKKKLGKPERCLALVQALGWGLMFASCLLPSCCQHIRDPKPWGSPQKLFSNGPNDLGASSALRPTCPCACIWVSISTCGCARSSWSVQEKQIQGPLLHFAGRDV